MKSNLLKKATALGVAASMLVTTSAFATTQMSDVSDFSKSTTATGTGTVVAPVFKVKIPSNLAYAIDPYELSPLATGSAINPRSAIKVPGYGYAISNASNIAVVVDVEATLTPVAGVFVVPSNGAINTFTTVTDGSLEGLPSSAGAVVYDSTNKDKEISLFMLIAKNATLSSTTALFAQPKSATYTKEGAVEVNVPGSTEKPARAQFLLDKGIVGTDGKPKTPAEINPSATACGVFSFQGDINQVATWAASDIKISVKYTFAPVPEAKKSELADGGAGYDGDRQAVVIGTAGSSEVAITPPETPSFTGGTYSKAAGTTGEVALTVDPGEGYRRLAFDTGTSTVSAKVGTVALVAADLDTTDATVQAIKIKSSGLVKIKALANGDYPFELTAKNGRTLKGTFKIES